MVVARVELMSKMPCSATVWNNELVHVSSLATVDVTYPTPLNGGFRAWL